jgi:hypothetical protein
MAPPIYEYPFKKVLEVMFRFTLLIICKKLPFVIVFAVPGII